MIQNDQAISGIIQYIRKEFIPALPSSAKVICGAMLIHNANRVKEITRVLTDGNTARILGVVTDGGNIDVDLWAQEVKQSMRDYSGGRIEINIPMLHPIIMNENDIDTLKRYMKGELQ